MSSDSVQPGTLIGERLGKYDLLALLALGGTAEIYLARIGGEAGFEKYVVVKCLLDHLADDAEFVRMFLDEARLGAQLDHSNIVQTLELGEHKGRYYMVMEYLAGMSLAQLARKSQERVPGGLIPIELVLGLAAQASSGLHYAHQRSSPDGTQLNIVHRDISPQNLVISFEGLLKIVDFGIAKADVRQTHTQSGTIKGKFAYMSPEQCLAKPIDRRTDIFALGVIVHELLTGRRLFKRSTTYETYQAIVNGKVPRPSSLNPKLDPSIDEVVMKALEYDKEKRYPTAEAFGEALLGYLHQQGRSVSASDVADYFDAHFSPEIDEHAERMRELIAGRATTNVDDLTWDSAEVASSSASAKEPPSPDAGGVSPATVPSLDPPGGGGKAPEAGEEEDEDQGGATRVEMNPLEQSGGGSDDDDNVSFESDTRVFDPQGSPSSPPSDVTGPTNAERKPTGKPGGGQERPTVTLNPPRKPGPGASAPPSGSPRKPTQLGTGTGPTRERPKAPPGPGAPPGAGPGAGAGPRPGAGPGGMGQRPQGGPGSGPMAPQPEAGPGSGPMAPQPAGGPGSGPMAPRPGGGGPGPGPGSGPSGPGSGPVARQPSGPGAAPTSAPNAQTLYNPDGAPRSASQPSTPPDTIPGETPPPEQTSPPPESSAERFPPVSTPAAFKPRTFDLESAQSPQVASRDLQILSSEKKGAPLWLIAVAFLVSAGVGLGATVLVVKLI